MEAVVWWTLIFHGAVPYVEHPFESRIACEKAAIEYAAMARKVSPRALAYECSYSVYDRYGNFMFSGVAK